MIEQQILGTAEAEDLWMQGGGAVASDVRAVAAEAFEILNKAQLGYGRSGPKLERKPRAGKGGVITKRDLVWLNWMARHRAVKTDQICEKFGVSSRVAWRRTGVMRDLGVLDHSEPIGGVGVYWVTPAGLKTVGTPSRQVRAPSNVTLLHELDVGDVSIHLEKAGWLLTTEREMLRHERRATRSDPVRYVVWRGGKDSGKGRHFPDLHGLRGGVRLAIEVERSAKKLPQVRTIFDAYLKAAHVDLVLYLASGGSHDEVERNLAHLLRVRDDVGGVGRIFIQRIGGSVASPA